MEQFYPYFDGDAQAKIKAQLGDDKLLVFTSDGKFHVASLVNDRYLVDLNSKNSPKIKEVIHAAEKDIEWLKTS